MKEERNMEKVKLTPRGEEKESMPIYFGVDWDEETPQIYNAIALDVLSLLRVVPSGCRLNLVCKSMEFLQTMAEALSIGMNLSSNVPDCSLWKLYFMKTQPPIPENGRKVYSKRVGMDGVNETRLVRGRENYPVLDDHDSRLMPPGKLYNVNKIPPRYYSQFPNMLLPMYY